MAPERSQMSKQDTYFDVSMPKIMHIDDLFPIVGLIHAVSAYARAFVRACVRACAHVTVCVRLCMSTYAYLRVPASMRVRVYSWVPLMLADVILFLLSLW